MTTHIRKVLFPVVALFTLLLSACATHQRTYSPQDQNPFSRQKPGQKPYTVAGKRYEPLCR